jgi:Transposase, Mutator family
VREETQRSGLGAILIDGIHFGKQVLVVALGIQTSGEKEVLGLWQGATENTTVVKELLEDLVARGLDLERRYFLVIDGAKALRAGIERVFGERAEVQRCQIHKRRNVKDHLPKNAQGDYDRRIRNAYAMAEYAAAKAELGKIFRQLERINASAAPSLEEGLEETLTVHRLDVDERLRRTLASSGSDVPVNSSLHVEVQLANQAVRLVLKKSGTRVRETVGDRLDLENAGAGVYRVEAFLVEHPLLSANVPWILSNPIFVGMVHESLPARGFAAASDSRDARYPPVKVARRATRD